MGKFISRKRLKLAVPALAVILVAVGVFLIVKNMNGPAEGSVAYQNPNQAAIKPTQNTPKKYNGKYIAFNYPAHYKIVPSQKSSGYLDTISLNNTDHSGKYVSVGVLLESINNDSGINHRKAYPELYKQVASSLGKVVFTGTQQDAEQTGFFAHNGLVTTVSVTAIGTKDLSQDFNVIVNSLQWKQ